MRLLLETERAQRALRMAQLIDQCSRDQYVQWQPTLGLLSGGVVHKPSASLDQPMWQAVTLPDRTVLSHREEELMVHVWDERTHAVTAYPHPERGELHTKLSFAPRIRAISLLALDPLSPWSVCCVLAPFFSLI
jgi:hypothetical protein